MTYTAKDIIKKAELAADLQNSDFISWYEKISLLNDAYTGLYQKLVNIGDMSFVKRIVVDKTQPLPCDFYQLKNLYLKNGMGTIQPIPRRSPSSSFNTLSYEILENTLYVYGTSIGEIVMEYFKTPCDLILKPEDKVLSLKKEDEILDCYGNKILVKDAYDSTKKLNIYDDDKREYIQTYTDISEIDTILEQNKKYLIVCGKNGIIYKNNPGSYNLERYTELFWNGKIKVIQDYTDCESCLFNIEGIIGTLGTKDGLKLIKSETFSGVEMPVEVPKKVISDLYRNVENGFVFLTYDRYNDVWFAVTKSLTVYIYKNGDENGSILERNITTHDKFTVDQIKAENGNLYMTGKGIYYKLNIRDYLNGVMNVVTNPINGKLFISDFDYDTGYGFIEKENNKPAFKTTFLEDSVLDFPTNFYFQMLSIMLAIQFKIKQGTDITLLTQQLTMYENVFYDTLTRDDCCYNRIKNYY